MKLRNKKTGKKAEVEINCNSMLVTYEDGRIERYYFDSLKELEEWEDMPEEPKEIYFISNNGQIHEENGHDKYREARKEIGNYFDTREEAEKAVEKLKAAKRLKDNGFMIAGWDYEGFGMKVEAGRISFEINKDCNEDKDLDLLFGGEG